MTTTATTDQAAKDREHNLGLIDELYRRYQSHEIQATGLLDAANCDGDHPCEDGDACEESGCTDGQHSCDCIDPADARSEAATHAALAAAAASAMQAIAALMTRQPNA